MVNISEIKLLSDEQIVEKSKALVKEMTLLYKCSDMKYIWDLLVHYANTYQSTGTS